MQQAVEEWSASQADHTQLLLSFSSRIQKSYVVYGQMILLPWPAFQLLPDHSDQYLTSSREMSDLYILVAKRMKVTHIATTRPIPSTTTTNNKPEENILRSPLNFLPLYGDFGPASCLGSGPTDDDLEHAYWAVARQSGITQTWAPRWTMFSRGNISEKARLLSLHSVLDAVQQGRKDGRGSAAVDLYVGIGYFAFSYLKAGIDTVLGWDLNPWSIEGCRRGSRANKWPVDVVAESSPSPGESQTHLTIFNESNANAQRRIAEMRHWLPPIRHVNCGLLPTSKPSWSTAVEILDDQYGGWIHVHENWMTKEIYEKADELVRTLQEYVRQRFSDRWTAEVEFINRLKSYAPGITHCVIDVHVRPLGSLAP